MGNRTSYSFEFRSLNRGQWLVFAEDAAQRIAYLAGGSIRLHSPQDVGYHVLVPSGCVLQSDQGAFHGVVITPGAQLPQTLDAITEVSLPVDAISGKPFEYRKTGATAALQAALPEGDKEEKRLVYEIMVKK